MLMLLLCSLFVLLVFCLLCISNCWISREVHCLLVVVTLDQILKLRSGILFLFALCSSSLGQLLHRQSCKWDSGFTLFHLLPFILILFSSIIMWTWIWVIALSGKGNVICSKLRAVGSCLALGMYSGPSTGYAWHLLSFVSPSGLLLNRTRDNLWLHWTLLRLEALRTFLKRLDTPVSGALV